jgi:ABC-type bacteriocin/lantibiotic exporter with double-glycine peptidase domain
MRLIRQRTSADCGVACIATLAGGGYAKALRTAVRLFERRIVREGLDDKQVLQLGRRLGLKIGREVRTSRWERVTDLALVSTHPRKRRDGSGIDWHWSVAQRVNGGVRVFDPGRRGGGVHATVDRIPLYSYREVRRASHPAT